ncbi:hypothetical protein [Actinoplanes auranticolor]|uniref:CBS domain-containing protein n=1 Tax=Actinoplanes auranticolor TaxID=47988 RepID=A0A919S4Y5_9ACTN|nr:hypothetical protein [Actinoplanes auranticolor]GIM65119.1 hypothetical protein Aau02nite_14870 [Actinoplanes auranticolor]
MTTWRVQDVMTTRSDLLEVHARPDAVIRDEVVQQVLRRTLMIRPGAVQAPAGVPLPTPGKKRRASWPSPALVGGRYHGEA